MSLMTPQKDVIKDLIATTVEGAVDGFSALTDAGLQIKLEEFEVETTYAATTEFQTEANGKVSFKMGGFKANYGTKVSRRETQTFGLKVRFLFTSI